MSVFLDELAYFVSRYPVAATDVTARQLNTGDLMGSVPIVNRSHLGVASGLSFKVFQEGLEQVFDVHFTGLVKPWVLVKSQPGMLDWPCVSVLDVDGTEAEPSLRPRLRRCWHEQNFLHAKSRILHVLLASLHEEGVHKAEEHHVVGAFHCLVEEGAELRPGRVGDAPFKVLITFPG
jgi:hypothetical protein